MSKPFALRHVEAILNAALHPERAQGWDNVGLLAGDPESPVRKVLLCIDLTPAVLQEARARRVQLVLAYHPPIFEPLKQVRADRQAVIFHAVRAGVAVYAIHTALDALPGGTSDALADLVDLAERKPIETVSPRGDHSKLVVFVPYNAEQLEKVSLAIFKAGGGQIGDYSCCSFLSAGNGTFLGGKTTHPAVGKPGRFESVEEMRMEVLVPNSKLPEVVRAMKNAHPYEEPAYDVYPLADVSTQELGVGRVGQLPRPARLAAVVALIKRRTGLKNLLVADGGKKLLARAAVGPGACGKMLESLAGKTDLFVTGEVRHHTALEAVRKGTSVICLGHGNSERLALKTLRDLLKPSLPGLDILLSESDADPLTIV